MKEAIQALINKSLHIVASEENIDVTGVTFTVENTKQASHGDLASNVAMKLAGVLSMPPRAVAAKLIPFLVNSDLVYDVTIAGPGFINFFIADNYYYAEVESLVNSVAICFPNIGDGKRVLLEYVSANPTGPLHVGHGRGAALGSALTSLYKAVGYDVVSEYYVNDAGRQMKILCLSVWLRYLSLGGCNVVYPENCYQGDYIIEIANILQQRYNQKFYNNISKKITVLNGLANSDATMNADECLDKAIIVMQDLLSTDDYNILHMLTLDSIRSGIANDLSTFKTEFTSWFEESSLHRDGLIDAVYNELEKNGALYEEDGAYWFAATRWGDDKDRVFKRNNGQYTYFAADVAYHWYKFQQGYDLVVDIFGADHHGYIARLRASLQALSCDTARLHILLVQFAALYRDGEKIAMSTRSGEFVTLSSLCKEVGVDAARYFYLMNKPQQHMEFDLALAKKKSLENPVYYVQYAHARIASLYRKLASCGYEHDMTAGILSLSHLKLSHERDILKLLSQYKGCVVKAVQDDAPYLLTQYLYKLSQNFHSYYNAATFAGDDVICRNARFVLLAAIAKVLNSGLELLGISAPDNM